MAASAQPDVPPATAPSAAVPPRDAMLPAVRAQVFVATPEAEALVAGVRGALSMKNVTWQAPGPGIDAALAHMDTEESGHILVIEKDRPLAEFLDALQALASKCGAQVRVFVIGRGADEADPVLAFRRMVELGVTDLILLPARPARLRGSIREAFASESRPKLGACTAFIGAGSGSGSSTVAQNVGYAMAQILQRPTLLTDFDPQYGTLAINFNLDNPRDLLAVENHPGSIDHRVLWQTAERVSEYLKVLPTLPDLNHAPDMAGSVVNAVLEVPFQHDVHVILDVPDVWTDTKRELLRQVDRLVIVAEPTLAGVQHIEITRDALERMEFNLARVLLVINQAHQPGRTEVPAGEITKATGFRIAAVLPYDARLLGKADAAGTIALDVSERRALSRGFVALARSLYDRDAASAPGLMARLRRRLRRWW